MDHVLWNLACPTKGVDVLFRHSSEFPTSLVTDAGRRGGQGLGRRAQRLRHPLMVAPSGSDRCGAGARLKSCEADRPAQARRYIEELEDELKLVNAAGALFNECQVISPRGVPACPRTEQLELLRTAGLPPSRAEPFRPGRTRRPPQRLVGPACRIYRTILLVSGN